MLQMCTLQLHTSSPHSERLTNTMCAKLQINAVLRATPFTLDNPVSLDKISTVPCYLKPSEQKAFI